VLRLRGGQWSEVVRPGGSLGGVLFLVVLGVFPYRVFLLWCRVLQTWAVVQQQVNLVCLSYFSLIACYEIYLVLSVHLLDT
jgi:hypothetical protein